MHLAIVIESSYGENTQLAELPGARASAELIATGLEHAGFVVERVPASRELAGYLDERLLGAATPFQSLFVYYSGYAALNPERGPALLLDGPRLRAFPVSRLGRSMMTAAYSAALVVDAVGVTEPGQTTEQLAAAIADTVPREGRVSTFAALRGLEGGRAWMPSRLSDLFVIALDWFESTGAEPGSVTLRALLSVMREERLSYSLIGATAELLPREDFVLLPARVPARPSGPVRSVAREPFSQKDAVASWAPAPIRRALDDRPLPSFDDPGERLPSFEPATDADEPPAESEAHLPSFIDAEDEPVERLPSFDPPTDADEGPLQIASVPSDVTAEALRGRPSFATINIDAEDLEDARESERDAARPEATADAEHGAETTERTELEEPKNDETEAVAEEVTRLPSFDELRGISELDGDEENVERSSVLPTPAARREIVSRPEADITDPETLVALVAAFDRTEEHAEAVAARERLARCLVGDPARRAYVLEEAARIAGSRLGDATTAVRLAREALDVDPTSLGALEVVATELGRTREWRKLADVYERVLLRLADGPIASRIASHLGTLMQVQLGDTEGALLAFSRALACDPNDPSLHRTLAELYEGRGDALSALAHRRAEAKAAPTTTGPYAAAVALFSAVSDLDGAWNAASALVALDGADDEARSLYDAYRDNGLLQVQRGLSAGDWMSGLLDPERDEEIAELFRIIEGAAARARLEQLARARALPELPESARHDPEKSTAMLARSLLWTSKLLGVPTPALYVLDEVNGMTTAPTPERTSLVSRSLASGLSLGELSFLWARHLTFQRESHRLLSLFPTPGDLANLLIAAKAVGSPQTRSIDFLGNEPKELAKALRRSIDEGSLEKLMERVRTLSAEGLADRAAAWAENVERVAGRVGLLACGDVSIATNLVTRFPLPGLVSPKEQIEDLLAYSISAEYGELRGRLGAQLRAHARRAG
ncbi:MAG TPA: hypothetical protein VHC69_14005 [Polyangiaceae bacterium]|nr:hypothetical protein [Polyangiaceae bacterium]